MITQFKIFENINSHHIGEYILYREYYYGDIHEKFFAYIHDISLDSSAYFPYKVTFIKNNKIETNSCNLSNIVRYLNDEEIKEFELEMSQIKYNL